MTAGPISQAYLITNVRFIDPGRSEQFGSVLVRDGRIDELRVREGALGGEATGRPKESPVPESDQARPPSKGSGAIDQARGGAPSPAGRTRKDAAESQDESDLRLIDGRNGLLTPGLIDLHTHGIARYSYEAGPESLARAGLELGRFGVTTVVPTVIPRTDTAGLKTLAELAEAIPTLRGVDTPGLHLEGPFVALGGAACATMSGDLGLLEELLAAAQGRTRIMSLSPETPGIVPVIERLCERGVRPFITHTRATVEQTLAALDAGATHATHFYDVFPQPPEVDPGVRPAGVVETMLADRRATVDFIADGVHVHPMAIRAAVAAKGWSGVTLITDSNIGAGLPPGVHDTPWGYAVRVRDGDGARHAEHGFLAGSALTMNRGMANLLRWLELPAHEVWAMGTLNPARLLGLAGKGSLQAGAQADLVLWDDALEPVRTWAGGHCIYERT